MKSLKSDKKKLVLIRSSRPDVFCKKGVLRNFAKFKGKHLCESLYKNRKKKQYSVIIATVPTRKKSFIKNLNIINSRYH